MQADGRADTWMTLRKTADGYFCGNTHLKDIADVQLGVHDEKSYQQLTALLDAVGFVQHPPQQQNHAMYFGGHVARPNERKRRYKMYGTQTVYNSSVHNKRQKQEASKELPPDWQQHILGLNLYQLWVASEAIIEWEKDKDHSAEELLLNFGIRNKTAAKRMTKERLQTIVWNYFNKEPPALA